MNILVTGGAGYIGSHACKALARAGHVPVTYDNLSRGDRAHVRYGPLEEGDTRDLARLRAALRRHRPAAVLHFAAFIAAGESVEQPELYWDNNVGGSDALLEAMRAEGVGTLVFSSTAGVYAPAEAPLAETSACDPLSPYAKTKFAVEQKIAQARTGGLRALVLRYFNAAGADPEGELGECHEPETHLIPLALEAAAGRRAALRLHGDDYPTPDGTCVRDYVHVSDLADAHVLALEALLAAGPAAEAGALNLGTGQGHSVAQVVAAVERVTGRAVPVERGPRRPGDPPALVADARRAARLLGWTPRFPQLDTMIAHAWAWAQRQN